MKPSHFNQIVSLAALAGALLPVPTVAGTIEPHSSRALTVTQVLSNYSKYSTGTVAIKGYLSIPAWTNGNTAASMLVNLE